MSGEPFDYTLTPDRPVPMVFGRKSGRNIRVLVFAEGTITWQPDSSWEHDSDSGGSYQHSYSRRVEEEWKQCPDEARQIFELRNGTEVIARHEFPGMVPAGTPEEEHAIEARWEAVTAFAKEIGVDLDLHGGVCERALDYAEGVRREPAPFPPLTAPVLVAEPLRQIAM